MSVTLAPVGNRQLDKPIKITVNAAQNIAAVDGINKQFLKRRST